MALAPKVGPLTLSARNEACFSYWRPAQSSADQRAPTIAASKLAENIPPRNSADERQTSNLGLQILVLPRRPTKSTSYFEIYLCES